MGEMIHTGGKYDPANQKEPKRFGWDDRTVHITVSKFDDSKGFPSFHLGGIAEGEEEERVNYYSVGGNNRISEDGETILPPEGQDSLTISQKSEFGRMNKALAESGAPLAVLRAFEEKASALLGLKFHMREQDCYNRDGSIKTKTGTKGGTFNVTKPYPARDGFRADGAKPGNGHADSAIEAKAVEVVVKVAQLKGGKATYTEISKGLFAAMEGDPDRIKVAGIVADRQFFKRAGRPWQTDGTAISL